MKLVSVSAFLAVTISIVNLVATGRTFANKFPTATRASVSGKVQILTGGPGPSLVTVSGRRLIVRKRSQNGALAPQLAYVIRGVDWSPASQNTDGSFTGRRNEFNIWKDIDVPLMKAMNVNTVYTFLDPQLNATGMSVLDQLYNNGIMVMMTIDEDGTHNLTRLQQAVTFYKDHPAILAWVVGNEWNINLYKGAASSVLDAAVKTEDAAQIIKSLDPNHPVATSYGDIDIGESGRRLSDTSNYVNNLCPSVDLWGLNIYRGNTFVTLFDQWKAISSKPMFLGEFGTDAFRSTNSGQHPPPGSVDGLMHAHWELSEWAHLFRNLSALDPAKVGAGGFVFEWNDEWWKVATPPNTQSSDGCDGTKCGGHPDHFGNEEYFGIVDINRQPRPAYDLLKAAFDSGYQPSQAATYRAVSRGGAVTPEYPSQLGAVLFLRDGEILYRKDGGDANAQARGFNVAVIDPCTNIMTVQHFDTFATRSNGATLNQMINFLDSLAPGVLVMIAVADEAGLNCFPNGEANCPPDANGCRHLSNPFIESFFLKLEALGSHQIRNYCFRNSWSMVAVKGEGVARSEQLSAAAEVSSQTTFPVLTSISPKGQSFPKNGGTGNVAVTAAGGCNWVSGTPDSWITITSGGSGAGNGTLNYSVGTNPGASFRTGTITVAGQLFAIVQSGFTDDPLLAGITTIKAQHIIELRQAVDSLRAVAGLGPAPWTDPTLALFITQIKAPHILELRSFLEDAAARLGFAAGSYTDSALGAGFVIKRIHIEELRQRVRAIAG